MKGCIAQVARMSRQVPAGADGGRRVWQRKRGLFRSAMRRVITCDEVNGD